MECTSGPVLSEEEEESLIARWMAVVSPFLRASNSLKVLTESSIDIFFIELLVEGAIVDAVLMVSDIDVALEFEAKLYDKDVDDPCPKEPVTEGVFLCAFDVVLRSVSPAVTAFVGDELLLLLLLK